MANAHVLHDGIYFGEGPRWHEGRLWYSDFYDRAVHAVDLDGNDERIVEVDQQPSGLGWMPDGTMLVVSMKDRRVLRWDGSDLSEHADLSDLATWHCNDMVVDSEGRAYVGNFGFDLDTFLEEHGVEGVLGDPGPTPTVLARIDPDGTVTVAAEDVVFPNGMAITPDGTTMILAETLAMRLTAFDVADDGGLSNRRVWADLSSLMCPPDGICLDADGAVWVANALGAQCLRVGEGGTILDEVTTSQLTYACMLGGPEGRHLFAMTATSSDHRVAGVERLGKIEVAEVAVPHAGLP
jgi:sugar lactone lactonase YvrE